MNRRGAETQRLNNITEKIIGAAIEVHKTLDPGLLESAYEECLCYELSESHLKFKRQGDGNQGFKSKKTKCFGAGARYCEEGTRRKTPDNKR